MKATIALLHNLFSTVFSIILVIVSLNILILIKKIPKREIKKGKGKRKSKKAGSMTIQMHVVAFWVEEVGSMAIPIHAFYSTDEKDRQHNHSNICRSSSFLYPPLKKNPPFLNSNSNLKRKKKRNT